MSKRKKLPQTGPPVHYDNFQAIRMEMPEEITRIQTALHKQGVLGDVDSSRFRKGITRSLVESKLAEVIVNTFRIVIWVGLGKSETIEVLEKAEAGRAAYQRAARALRRVDPALSKLLAHNAGVCAEVVGNMKNLGCWGEQHSEELDDLVFDLRALLTHTTDLTKDFALKHIIPRILDAAWACYPKNAPVRGNRNPLARYKRIVKRWSSRDYRETHILARRLDYLFAGDDRFPSDLFRPHRAIRTVPTYGYPRS